MNIKPMVDRVLVKQEEIKESKGGVILPDSAQERDLVYGIIIALGAPRKDYIGADDIKVGCKVAFVKYSGANIVNGNEKYIVVRYDDILAIIS